MVDIQKELTSIDSANLWQLLDEANERDTGLSLLLYVVKNKWEKRLKNKFGRKEEKVKTHLLISGGNYTCDILMPYMLKRIKGKFPLYPIHLGLAEYSEYRDLSEIDHDIMLSGFSSSFDSYHNFKKSICAQGYDATRRQISDDIAHISCSKEVFESYSKEEILQKFPLIRGRYFRDTSSGVKIPDKFRAVPRGREDEAPLIISDKYYYGYLLMKYSVGLWCNYTSAPHDGSIRYLEELEKAGVARYVIYNREYGKIGKILTKQFQVFLKKDLQQDKNRVKKGFSQQFWI